MNRPVGRPTIFQPDYVEQVERFCRVMGSLDADIAQFFAVHVDTIYEWKKVHPEFSEAVKRGKAICDREVGEKLVERAMDAKFYQDTSGARGGYRRNRGFARAPEVWT